MSSATPIFGLPIPEEERSKRRARRSSYLCVVVGRSYRFTGGLTEHGYPSYDHADVIHHALQTKHTQQTK